MKTPIFTGSGLAMITPMNADGSVNYAEIDRILEDQIGRASCRERVYHPV